MSNYAYLCVLFDTASVRISLRDNEIKYEVACSTVEGNLGPCKGQSLHHVSVLGRNINGAVMLLIFMKMVEG